MYATAEAAQWEQSTNWQTAEYALSLERLRLVGRIALAGEGATRERSGAVDQLRAEFDTSLSEMLKTDREFGRWLEISRFESYDVVAGKTMAHDGVTPVVSMLENGYMLSSAMAEDDPRMATQAARDRQDLLNAYEVDAMVSGARDYNTRIVMSLMPEEAIARDGEDYWRGMGYFPETKTAFLQMYHVTEQGELITGTLSVDATDKASIRKLWSELGVEIPEDASTDAWLQYALTDTLSTESAMECAEEIRQKHYANVGHEPTKLTSVEDVLAANKSIVEQSFQTLQLSLAESIAQAAKTQTITGLMNRFMQNSNKLSADVRSGLIGALNRSRFTDADARLAYKLIMYATAEKIRESLPLGHTAHRTNSRISSGHVAQIEFVHAEMFMNQIVRSAFVGIAQNRSYGACGASIKLGGQNDLLGILGDLLNPQDVFGGKSDEDQGPSKKKWMNCPHCTADVYDDPCAKVLSCWDCKAKVVNGRVVSTGNGGSRRRMQHDNAPRLFGPSLKKEVRV